MVWVLIIGLANSVGVVCDCLLIGWDLWLIYCGLSCLFAVVCGWLLLVCLLRFKFAGWCGLCLVMFLMWCLFCLYCLVSVFVCCGIALCFAFGYCNSVVM